LAEVAKLVQPQLEQVETRIAQQASAFDPAIEGYVVYAVGSRGKRLRPLLALLAGGATGKIHSGHIDLAVIVELIHLATLVHDDVMDEAEIRRGRLTLAANWGNEIAVLFGDCLFAQALKLAASFPTPEVCRAVALATNTVCSGEILQTQHRRDFQFTREKYFKVLEMKTAELFALSCELSACLSGTTAELRLALRQFGLAFGTAYQVYDDCVDLFGSEAAAGKSLGTDLAKGKLTWPVLLAWERADTADKMQLEDLIKKWQPENLRAVNELLVKYETFEPSLEVISRW
jgi:octaprenyl-diphosphate synthase